MESTINIPNVDISLVRRYSLAELDEIDFSTSDDFAIVVENLKNVITLEKNIEDSWTEDHEQILWQFVIDPDSCVLTSYFVEDSLIVECCIPKVRVYELFYIIKISPEKLVSSDYGSKLLFGTAKAPFFESLYESLCVVYLPMFSKSMEWSKCIKSDYLEHLSKFLLELFDMRNKLHKEMVLYVPDEIIDKDMITIIEQKDLLNQVEKMVHKKFASSVWSIKEISPQINLFIHRCEELIQICELKDELNFDEHVNTYSPGQKCYEVAEQLTAIEKRFWNLLQELGKNKHVSLQMRSAVWYEFFRKFKIDVSELEISISKLMLNALENLNTVEEGILILKMFKKHFKKQVIKRDLRRCIKTLYEIFLTELNFLKEKFVELRTSDNPLLPMYGGTAFSILVLPQRVKQLYEALIEASKIWPRECDVDIADHFQRIMDSNNELIHTLFLQWIKTIPKDPYSWLKEPIFIKKENTPFIQLNLNSDTLNLIQELYYWDKIGVEIPQQVVHLHEKNEVFLKRIMKMLESVKNYNRIIKCLSSEENGMFDDILASIEAEIKPIFSNLNWAVAPSTLKLTLKVLYDKTKMAKEIFSQYETNKIKIQNQCEEIGRKSLFNSHINEPQEHRDFLQTQEVFREKGIQEVAELIKAEIYEANQICNIFLKKKSEVNQVPAVFPTMFLTLISSALIKCYITSLKVVASLIGANRANKIRMIFKLYLNLGDHQMCFVPNFKEFCLSIEKVIDDIETALATLMVFEENLIGDIDAKNYFLENVRNTENIQSLKQEIDYGLYLLYEAEKNYKLEWKPYACLWETSKKDLLKGYEEKGWNAFDFEADINRFLEIGKKVLLIPRYKALEFSIVDCQHLKDSAVACSKEWKTELGSILKKISCSNLQNAFDLFEVTSSVFMEEPKNLKELKDGINFLINMKKYSKEIQSTFKSVQRNFQVLKRIEIPISEESLDQHQNLNTMWKTLENNFNDYYIKLQKIQAFHQRQFLAYHEELENKTTILEEDLSKNGPFQIKYTYSVALNLISLYHHKLRQLQEKETCMKTNAVFFHLQLKPLNTLISIEKDLDYLNLSWSYVKLLDDYLEKWGSLPIMAFDVKNKMELSNNLRDNIKSLLQKVKGTQWILLEELLDKLSNLDQNYEMLLDFQEPALQERHWNALQELLGITCDNSEQFFKSDQFTFAFLNNMAIENLPEQVNRIAKQARKEFEIEQAIKEIEKTWESVCFKMSYCEKFHKMEDSESIVSLIERHQMSLGIMKASKYVSYFSAKVNSLEDSLLLVLDIIKQADYFQSKFYLLERERIVTLLATGMYSEFDEFVEFQTSVELDGPVESWLLDIEEMMQKTLYTALPKCLQALSNIISKEEFNFSNVKWLNNWPAQICILSILITWTAETTNSIKVVQETAVTTALKNLRKRWRDILNQSVLRLQNEPDLLTQKKAFMMIISLVHSCDIIDSLISYVCNDPGSFEWLVHLRYYIEEEKQTCLIKQSKAVFKYGFEYLGNRERLVITPLTDRCFLSFTTALYLNQGATLKGCRSSGKTETLKDLAINLGKYILVINCSEGLNERSSARMLTGLAQIGAWGLFENSNCIKGEIISMLSQEINCIFKALVEKKKMFSFFGSDVALQEGCGIFLSENPAKDQLSKYDHYDFGLRVITNYLKQIGKQRRLFPKLSDLEIIIATLRSISLPKLHSSDVRIFENILETVFGNIKGINAEISKLTEDIKKTLRKKSFQPEITTVQKISQLYEIKDFHHSIILVGDAGSGKTTSWQTLKETFSDLHETKPAEYPSVNVYTFNSKAYTLNELYGYFNENGVWIDGLFSSILKEACNDFRAKERWIVLNGLLDNVWLESINSLLDCNKVLTTANGERIMLLPEVTLLFEATNLVHCSPNVISHCGIIYHESTTVNWKIYLKSWLQNLEMTSIREILEELFERYLSSVLDYCGKALESSRCVSNLNKIFSLVHLLNVFLKKISSDKIQALKLSRIFWKSITWSIGAILDEKDRLLFNDYIKTLDQSLEDLTNIYVYNLDENFEWVNLNMYLDENWQPHPRVHFENILVPTVATLSYQHTVEMYLGEMKPVLLIGANGSGKTILAENVLYNMHSDLYLNTFINFSPQTTSSFLQEILEKQLDKKAGGLLFPHSGKRMIVFLDDFDKGKSDKFGSQSALELLYMSIDGAYWYNRKKWKLNHLQNLCFLATANYPSSHFNKIPEPLLNKFSVINILPPKESQMKYIFASLLKKKLLDSSIEIRRTLNAISLGCMAIFKIVREIFLPTPSRIHYLFDLKDVKKVLCQFLNVNPELLCDKIAMTKFWYHECSREFSDRFVDNEDKKVFFNILEDVIEKEFLIQYKDHFKNIKDLKFLCRIIRGIENSHGNMLLLGATGTGKFTLSRIAAFILKYEVFEMNIEKNIGLLEFKRDLHDILYKTGVKKQKLVYLISDDQITDDIILHYMSDILTVGVPLNIFTSDELKMMYSEISFDKNECHRVLIENIRSNLHLIFCLNYTSPLYKKCFLNYPAIYKNCTLNWFDKWPHEALEKIACKFLKDIDLKPTSEDRLDVCCKFLSNIHVNTLKYSKGTSNSNRISFEASSTFIKLVNTFKIILAKRQQMVEKALLRLASGLQKIHETQEMVNEIARETKEAQERLIIAEKECDEALNDIQLKKIILAEKQESIQIQKIEIEKKERVCKRIAIAAEEDLNAAMPALEEARKALESLNKRDIGEIKSYAKPPVIVEMVLEAVMILRNSEPSWVEAKRQLGSPSFLKELLEYDRDNITDAALAKIGKYIKKSEFQPDIVGKVSFAAKSLSIWVRAMYVYGNIYKKVKPKIERLRIAKEELERLQNTLTKLLNELAELEASITKLEKEHQLLIEKKEELSRKEKELALKLKRAESIMEGLKSEKERWQEKVSTLTEKRKFVIGDSFLASGYLTYLGPHDQSQRAFFLKRWKRSVCKTIFVCSLNFDLADFFVDEEVKNEWKMKGLPSDQYSNEGAAIVTESCYCPFVIDPESQAIKWIKNMEAKRKIKCFDCEDSKWILALEAAVTEGFPLLLQNVNPALDSHLSAFLKQSLKHHSFINFNNKRLKVNPSFQLYLLTKLMNPQFTSTAINLTTIVNFTIKEKGLEDQLLPLIILNERSDLETKKEQLVKSIMDCKKQLSEIEDTVLKLLKLATGSLLDDEVLVQALQRSKISSVEIEEKLASNEKTEAIIDSARDKYRPCAKMASILYFVLTDMVYVDPMYVFTLDSYIALFLNSINKSPKDPEASRRILKLNVFHQREVYRYACRTVLEKHALLLAFYICSKILLVEGHLDKAEYEFFVRGSRIIDHPNESLNPCSQWLSQESWDNVTELERLPRFLSITVSFDENSRLWQDWYLALEPERRPLPGIWRNVCSGFQMLLIIRCLRLDRVTSCVSNLIHDFLGKSFLEYPSIEIREIFNESSPNKPLVLFTVSSDTDPGKIIENLAQSLGIKYRAISLGKGQESAASQLIIDSAKVGYWVFISKCHLLLTWLPALEKFVNRLQTIKVHEKFRLWLGSAPTKLFPTSVLQNSIIISLDSPKGIRTNMLNMYKDLVTEEDIKTSTCETKYKCLLFTLSFFHSILLGRKRFQNLGWNFNYNFTKEDFKTSSKLLKLYLDEYKDTSWNALKSMIAEVIYGGHIADVNDERLLMIYYDQFFCDEIFGNVKHRLTPVPDYCIPEDGPLDTYLKFIEELPGSDTPEVFGQHSNAEIPYRVQDAKEMLDNMKKIAGESFTVKNIENQVTKMVSDIKLQIPNLLDEMAALDILHEKLDPYSEVLVQETKRYNGLLKLVFKSLNELEASTLGKMIMTEELEEFSKIILKMEVPQKWQKLYPTLKPLGSWIQDLNLRIEQFAKWILKGNMPVKLWMPGISAPKSILNASLQIMVKNSDVILKELIWEYHVSTLDESHITEAPLEGIYIRGLLLEGAGWDKTNGILIESEPLHLITTMPVILFKPVIESSVRGVYDCPCYYTSKRTDDKGNSSFLFSVDLRTKKVKEYWMKRGISLILSSK
ncbi:dynein heavy chain 2, axonemal [Nephila pilipes]|uniref:Dynein heavy chain 2, axonemal n=1 Tax=Nephila pilipes TaxID=299642 RepID=A0A8X6PDU9_NEPPI|nr:dynein heavy chain 2, axonemal [Nephila pilipes]